MLPEIPPVVHTVNVARPPGEACRAFVEQLGEWWPIATHSVSADHELQTAAIGAVFEPRAGGRVYEVMADGGEGDWATVITWDPPSGFVLAWQPNPDRPAATDVEVRFVPDGAGTRVVLEHRGWERLGEDGPRSRESYDAGWVPVLDRFVQLIARSQDSG